MINSSDIMADSDYKKLEAALRRVMALLASRQYEGLIAMCPSSTISAEELRAAVDEHPATIVVPPFDDDYRKKAVYLIEKTNTQVPTWAVDAQVWTAEEGYSDLTLTFDIVLGSGEPEVILENLRVL